MAVSFSSVQKNLSTISTLVYTSGSSSTTIAFAGTLANTHGSDIIYVSLRLTNGSITTNILGANTPVVPGSALEIPKITLVPNAYITAIIGAADVNKADITLSLMTI